MQQPQVAFAPNLDLLRLDPDLQIPARPFIEVESEGLSPPILQVYSGSYDRGFPAGTVIELPDEKVSGLRWRIVRRWLYIPSQSLSISCDGEHFFDTTNHLPMAGSGPYIPVNKKAVLKLRRQLDAEMAAMVVEEVQEKPA